LINEPTLEQYVYYLRRVEGDNVKTIQERRAAFERELRALLAHLERLSGQPIPPWEWPQEKEDRHVSQRIVRTNWLDNPATGRAYFVEARTYGDVYWLQVGYYQEGQTEVEIFAGLRDEAWQPAATDQLLGVSAYLCGIATDAVDDLAARALAVYTGEAAGAILSTHLTNGRGGLYGASGQPYVTALFYPDGEAEAWVGQTLLNDIALRLELYHHKADRQLAWCEQNWPMLSEQEQTLRDLLAQVQAGSSADAELLHRLVRLYRVFNSNVGMLVERQATIDINLRNLDTVLKELEPLAGDHLLRSWRDHLHRRQAQLKADLTFADQARQEADRAITALQVELGLDRLLSLPVESDNQAPLESSGFPGTAPPLEGEIEALNDRSKPPPAITYPQIEVSPRLQPLTATEIRLLQQVYRNFGRVLVEQAFTGGYSGTRVLLILPVTTDDRGAARKITKLGPALDLRRERDNFQWYVEDFLPFCVARVETERYAVQDGQAGLNYAFVGGGALGRAIDLEAYYHRAGSAGTVEPLIKTLEDLLVRELGQHWYGQATPLRCFFAAEYGPHLVEHVRLKLRPGSSDDLWMEGQSPPHSDDYKRIERDTIFREYDTIQPGTPLVVEGMVIKRLKAGEIKLQDPEGRGIVVRAEFTPGSMSLQGLEINSQVGVRGEVVYNRRGRLEEIVAHIFPSLSPGIGSETINLPGVAKRYPNPLHLYTQILGDTLEGRQSYVHGDLHLRNVLVDEGGKGWLIDFARVERRHNLFDFIKLETYVRRMGLGSADASFSLAEYAQFEAALAAATLGNTSVSCPDVSPLRLAYDVILAIRDLARNYMEGDRFLNEYFPALFLYSLALMKYHREDQLQLTRLTFATAAVLAGYLLAEPAAVRPSATGQTASTTSGRIKWNTSAIRDLLIAALSDEELTEFCFDHFHPVYEQFSIGMSKTDKIQRLLDFCHRSHQMEELLSLIKEHTPAQYARFMTDFNP
jgi:hypothetical protein